ncbi:TIGR03089 family protein [Cryptosporangium sp. NPDC051539]|uniref:TIGR03089 family protein n=1 Tax=Cryptosporangium sp. NPDC051539 TaxID=3363962 RepID=UPI0037A93419
MNTLAVRDAVLPAAVDQPVLIYRDDATGERTELSVRELSGWAARTAALLHEGCGLQVGAQAAVLLPPHWQTAGVLLGAWAAGVSVSYQGWSTAGLEPAAPMDVRFVSAARRRSVLENLPEAPHRFVLGLGQAVSDDVDFVEAAGRYSPNLPSYAPLRWTDEAGAGGVTYRELGGIAAGVADMVGLRGGDRLLVDADSFEQPIHWLLTALSVGASVVVCANLDRSRLDQHIAADGVTHVL